MNSYHINTWECSSFNELKLYLIIHIYDTYRNPFTRLSLNCTNVLKLTSKYLLNLFHYHVKKEVSSETKNLALS